MIHIKCDPNANVKVKKVQSQPKKENKVENPIYKVNQILLTPSVAAINLSLDARISMKRQDFWHKFIILNGISYEKEYILKIITEFIYPLDLIPVMYRVDGKDTCFLARNCAAAIDKICREDMEIKKPNGKKVVLNIVLGFSHVGDIRLNMQENLVKVIMKRYNKETKHLDLSNYHRDPDICDLIYCPLSIMRILRYILSTLKSSVPSVMTIDLSHNEISFVKPLEVLIYFQPIRKIDLSHNMVKSVNDLEVLRDLHVRELVLDQNPCCQDFKTEQAYIEAVKNSVPSLIVLDGAVLGPAGFPRSKRNFMMHPGDVDLADQFVRHYFTLYDGNNRRNMEGLYHKDALFSMTATFMPAQSTSHTARLAEYTIESRNILKLSDYTKNMKLLHYGSDAVLATLCKLPRSDHDPYSFSVDVVHHSVSGVLISVSGVFREPTLVKTPLIRSFHRVFVLVKVSPNEYQIINEMMHISNATTRQAEEAFKFSKPSLPPQPPAKPINLTEQEKNSMTEILSQLSEMNLKWSRKCLEESKWDIRDALTVFLELYKISKIPIEAFTKNE